MKKIDREQSALLVFVRQPIVVRARLILHSGRRACKITHLIE